MKSKKSANNDDVSFRNSAIDRWSGGRTSTGSSRRRIAPTKPRGISGLRGFGAMPKLGNRRKR